MCVFCKTAPNQDSHAGRGSPKAHNTVSFKPLTYWRVHVMASLSAVRNLLPSISQSSHSSLYALRLQAHRLPGRCLAHTPVVLPPADMK